MRASICQSNIYQSLEQSLRGGDSGIACRLMYAYTEIPALISVGEKWDAVSSVSLGSQRALFKRCFRSDVMNLASHNDDCTENYNS